MPASWACVSSFVKPASLRRSSHSRSDQYASALAFTKCSAFCRALAVLWQTAPAASPGATASIAGSSPLSILCKIALLFKQIGVIDVVTAQSVAPRRTIMTTFTIDNDNNITAFGSAEEAAAATTTPFDSFASQKELAKLNH